MKKGILLLTLLLSLGQAFAEYIDFADGRSCRHCTAEVQQGFVVSVKDSEGKEWLDPSQPNEVTVLGESRWWPSTKRYTTPAGKPPSQPEFLDKLIPALLMGAGAGMQNYSQTVQRQAPVYKSPASVNCQTTNFGYGYSNTNCTSY